MKYKAGRPPISFFSSMLLWLLGALLLMNTGCLNQGSGSEDATQVVAEPGEVPPPPYTTPERTLCDPFDAGGTARDRGLVGHLLYLTDEQPRYNSVMDLIEHGTPVQSTIYLDQVYVPTRAFDLGFYTQTGELVLNQNAEPLYEYFALRMESQLTLGQSEPEGWYQMAILADDGAILSEKLSDGSESVIVDNDGTHPTKMGCGSRSIYMDHDTKKDVILYYHQGPRFHIANIVMWRPLPEGVNPEDPISDIECGRQGNARYFDSTKVPSVPTTNYYEMLARGWKPLTNENYSFPVQASNPCATDDPLLLTNFSLGLVTRTAVTVSWVTSGPATSQVEVKNISTGEIFFSTLDSTEKTSHLVTFSGLMANTLYSIKALSTSGDGQSVQSAEAAFRTPR